MIYSGAIDIQSNPLVFASAKTRERAIPKVNETTINMVTLNIFNVALPTLAVKTFVCSNTTGAAIIIGESDIVFEGGDSMLNKENRITEKVYPMLVSMLVYAFMFIVLVLSNKVIPLPAIVVGCIMCVCFFSTSFHDLRLWREQRER